MNPRRKAHLVQYIDRAVDVSVDKEPGEAALTAEGSRSCCTKRYSDVEAIVDIRPDSVVMIDEIRLKSIDAVVGDKRSTDQPDARQQVDCQGLLGRRRRHRTQLRVVRRRLRRRQERSRLLDCADHGVESLAWILVLRQM